MPIFIVPIEIEVEADNIDQAWEEVAEPFHSNEISVLIPAMLNWHIGEAEPVDEEYTQVENKKNPDRPVGLFYSY